MSAELKTRTLSAIVLGAAILYITARDPVSFYALLMLGAAILIREWIPLIRYRHFLFIPFALLYTYASFLSLAYLRHGGAEYVFLLFALVWGADIGAYLVGKRFGKHKIAPSISPGKSWEGLLGAVLVTTVIVAVTYVYFPRLATVFWLLLQWTGSHMLTMLAVGVLFAVVGLAGDMFESHLKRRAGVKDSGRLIPGHGGLFDRIDALMPCAILMAIFFQYTILSPM